jgi:hypothetical protein
VVADAGVDEAAAARRRKPRNRSLVVAGAMACSCGFLAFLSEVKEFVETEVRSEVQCNEQAC